MDKKEFSIIQNATRAVAAEAIVKWQSGVIQKFLKPFEADARSVLLKAMELELQGWKDHYRTVVIKGVPPEQSDLIAGEFQEAFEKLAKEVIQKL